MKNENNMIYESIYISDSNKKQINGKLLIYGFKNIDEMTFSIFNNEESEIENHNTKFTNVVYENINAFDNESIKKSISYKNSSFEMKEKITYLPIPNAGIPTQGEKLKIEKKFDNLRVMFLSNCPC